MEQVQLLTQREAGKIKGVSRQTISRWVREGRLLLYYGAFKSKWKKNKRGWISPLELNNI